MRQLGNGPVDKLQKTGYYSCVSSGAISCRDGGHGDRSGTGEHEKIPVMAYVMNELMYHLPGSQRQLHQFGRFV